MDKHCHADGKVSGTFLQINLFLDLLRLEAASLRLLPAFEGCRGYVSLLRLHSRFFHAVCDAFVFA